MTESLGLLETTGLTPAMVAIDAMTKGVSVRVLQVELNDFYGVCVKVVGSASEVQRAIDVGRRVAEQMQGRPLTSVLARVDDQAFQVIQTPPEFNPLIQQDVVMQGNAEAENLATRGFNPETKSKSMNQEIPQALGFIETQGFTAVFEAIDTACKAAAVDVIGKEKLGGGYVTVVIQGELSAVSAAVAAAKENVGGLGKLIAAHVIARPSPALLKLLPRL